MSKAFTKDDDAPEPVLVPPRAPLPEGAPNYVTPRGLALLRDEAAALEAQRAELDALSTEAGERRRQAAALAVRQAQLTARLASAVLVEPGDEPPITIRFGVTVTVRGEDGEERRHRIVGADEADPASGDIAFTSPIARALLGREPGDEVLVDTPRGKQALEILTVERG